MQTATGHMQATCERIGEAELALLVPTFHACARQRANAVRALCPCRVGGGSRALWARLWEMAGDGNEELAVKAEVRLPFPDPPFLPISSSPSPSSSSSSSSSPRFSTCCATARRRIAKSASSMPFGRFRANAAMWDARRGAC